MQFCKNCGLLLPQGASTCPKCGLNVPPIPFDDTPSQLVPLSTPPASGQPSPEAPSAPIYEKDVEQDTAAALTTGSYFLTLLLFSVPIVGLVLLFVWALKSDTPPARRNLARAYLLRKALLAIALLFCLLILGIFLYVLYSNPFYTYSMFY